MWGLKYTPSILGLCSGFLVISNSAASQEAEPVILTFNVGTEMRADDNYGLNSPSAGTSVFLNHTLGFDLSSQTETQSLDVGASSDFRQGNIRGSNVSTGSDNEHLYLKYRRETANSRLGVGATYNSSDVSSTFLLADPDLPFSSDLIVDRGNLVTYGANAKLDLGINAPFGVTFTGRHNTREYQNTTSTSLFDSETNAFTATGNLRFSSVLTGTIEAAWDQYTAKDTEGTDRKTTRFGFGLQGSISPVLSFSASLSQNHINTDETVGGLRRTTKDDGLSGSFGLTRALQNGTATARLSNTFSTNGNRVSLVLGRTLDLPSGGALSTTLGATKNDGGPSNLIGSLDYKLERETSAFSVSLSRRYQTSTDEEEIESTSAAVGYDYQINSVANLRLSLDYAEIQGDNAATVSQTTRSNFRVIYNRDLASDWVLSGGYEARYSDSDTNPSARSNAVFLSLNKSFIYKP